MSQDKNIVIIGCGAGGGTAAQFARKTDRKSSITIFEKGRYPQYSKCGIPHAISSIIPKINDLIEYDENWFKKANIELFLKTNVETIDAKKRIVIARKDENIIKKSYDSLIICTGAKPKILPILNIEKNDKLVDGVFVVRTIDDAELISKNMGRAKNAVIIGAGLIGFEMADTLFNKGMKVTIVETHPDILPYTIDGDMAKLVKEKIPRDINIFTHNIASKIETADNKIKRVFIKDNKTGEEKTLDADLMIIAAGTNPNIELAKSIGCKIGKTGGVIVNNKSETSIKSVYSVGDCTEYKDFITAKPVLIGLGSIAVRQGIAAGVNAAEGEYKLPGGALNTSTSEFFGIEIAAVGPVTNNIKDDFSIVTGRFNGLSLPDYYPGGKPVSVKVIADKYTGMIMGAQCVGDKAAQRINTFACAILAGLDIETFRKLETAYAPSIAPTLDAVTLACDIVSLKLNRK